MANRIKLGAPQPTAGPPDREGRDAFDQRIGNAYRSQLAEGDYRLSERDRDAFLARMKQASHRAPERDRTRAMLDSSQRQTSRRRGLTAAAAFVTVALIVGIGVNQNWPQRLSTGLGSKAGSPTMQEGGMLGTEAAGGFGQEDADGLAEEDSMETVAPAAGAGSLPDPAAPEWTANVISQGSLPVTALGTLVIDYPAEVLLTDGQQKLALDYTFSSEMTSTLLKPEVIRFSTRIGESDSGTAIPRDLSRGWIAADAGAQEWTWSADMTEHLDLPFTYRILLDIGDLSPGTYNLTFSIGGAEAVVPISLREAAG